MAQRVRPGGTFALYDGADALDGVDDVLAGALRDLERHGRAALGAREPFGVHERASHLGDVADGDDGVAANHEGHVQDVLDRLEQPRDLDREPAPAGILGSRRDHQVAVADRGDGLVGGKTVALDSDRIDDHFHQILAIARDLGRENAGDSLDRVPELAREPQERPFRDVAREDHNEDREQAQVDFVHRRFVGAIRKLGLREVDLFAHVVHGGVGVEPRLELEDDASAAFVARRAHLLEAFDHPQLCFHGPDQEPFGIFGRDAVEAQAHVDDGDADVGIRFLGNLDVGHGPADQNEQ